MNILAVGANPDDIEFLCSGTLALYAQNGHRVSMAYLTAGDKGGEGVSPGEIAATRKREAEKAAALIGADVFPLGIPDGEVEPTLENRRLLVDVIRKSEPDVIITHNPNDYMSDHCYTSALVCDAAFWAAVPNYEGRPDNLPKCGKFASLYYMDTLGGIGFQPEEYVDITAVFERKLAMLSCHKSQLEWMKKQSGMDFPDYMRTAAKYRGYQCGAAYAEGFIAAKKYLSLTTKRLLP